MVTILDIREFISTLSSDDLNLLYRNYSRYQSILKFPIRSLTRIQQEKALLDYLGYYIIEKISDERSIKLTKIVSERNKKELIITICTNQYFEEPLMHMVNQETKYYSLS
jgi:hypothetical protein